ncbi:hypothetical protein [Marimonas arenosa]|uniref:Uncharacterized protein n=1 Tax=Marimonas arenosa TaxID=1795305 RepID=A0AAE3WBL8_9RHOB|nr:hypothetical protein [Marimonas arenosa]MDQ2088705.1 hypothetical protein [Marimonas arenosa]
MDDYNSPDDSFLCSNDTGEYREQFDALVSVFLAKDSPVFRASAHASVLSSAITHLA